MAIELDEVLLTHDSILNPLYNIYPLLGNLYMLFPSKVPISHRKDLDYLDQHKGQYEAM